MKVLFKRQDGTFVIEKNKLPYHVLPSDPLFAEAEGNSKNAPFEVQPKPEVVDEKRVAEADRQYAYVQEADPLFFKWQAGEATQEEWLAKREEIRLRYPYPTEE
jgi:hypothetical protein